MSLFTDLEGASVQFVFKMGYMSLAVLNFLRFRNIFVQQFNSMVIVVTPVLTLTYFDAFFVYTM